MKLDINSKNVYPINVSLIGTDDARYKNVPPTAKAGMVCYYDGALSLKFCYSSKWNTSLGMAIGVVVPSDGTARIMAINGVNTGGSSSMDNIPTWDNTIGGTIGYGICGYLHSNKGFTSPTYCINERLKYYDTVGQFFIHSPYLAG